MAKKKSPQIPKQYAPDEAPALLPNADAPVPMKLTLIAELTLDADRHRRDVVSPRVKARKASNEAQS